MSESPRTARAAVGMGAITAVSRLVGFVRVLVVAAVLGTTFLGNAFQSANSVSNVLFELVAAGALSAVLVPAFIELLRSDDPKAAEEVAGGVLGFAMTALGIVALVGIVLSPILARGLTLGVPERVATDERRLVTFLLIFFLPQVVLYAGATVATGVLHAKRKFMAAAAAPMASTVVMVVCLVAFQATAGSDAGLDLSLGSRLLLVGAGTGGVLAFAGVLVAACRATGFRLRPRRHGRKDPRVVRLLHQAGWGVVLHTSAGVLLGGAIISGAAVAGGVVAYQGAWVFFLAPYAIFSQPIQVAILPELVVEARDVGLERYAMSARWAVERIGLTILPISAAMVALAEPAMRIVLVGEASKDHGPEVWAAALAALAVGLFPYGLFMMLARAYYALDDPKTPGKVALVVAAVGAGIMAIGAPLTEGTMRIAVLGFAHTGAHLVGATMLIVGLRRRTGHPVISWVVGLMVAVNVAIGTAIYLGSQAALEHVHGRVGDIAVCVGSVIVGGVLVLISYQLTGVRHRLTHRAPITPDEVGPDPNPDPDSVPTGGFS